MAQTTDMPVKFLDSLQATAEPWGRELLAHNLQTVFNRRFQSKRYLLRSLQQEVRGFLSDSYRRIDSRPVVEAFAIAVEEKGALPYEGYVTDTRIAIQAMMPEVYEPVPGEVVAYGLSLENSDFGNGALSVRAYLPRVQGKYRLKGATALSSRRRHVSTGSPFEPKVGISRAVRAGKIIAVTGTAPLSSEGRTVAKEDRPQHRRPVALEAPEHLNN